MRYIITQTLDKIRYKAESIQDDVDNIIAAINIIERHFKNMQQKEDEELEKSMRRPVDTNTTLDVDTAWAALVNDEITQLPKKKYKNDTKKNES